MKTIGILGGMGPEATAQLYLEIIRLFQQQYGAKYDADFPEMVIVNLPLPDVVENPETEKVIEQMLIYGVKKIESAGATFIAIPCNTAISFLPAMQKMVSIPIVSIVEETAKNVQKWKLDVVGIVGTEMTLRKNTYGKALGGTKLIVPKVEDQKATTQIIMNILAGRKERNDQERLLRIIRELKRRGAEKVIMGCTELPLLISENEDVIDTIKILARATVRESLAQARENLNKPTPNKED